MTMTGADGLAKQTCSLGLEHLAQKGMFASQFKVVHGHKEV